MIVGEVEGETHNYYTHLATFGAYTYRFTFEDYNGTLTLDTATGAGPASDEYTFEIQDSQMSIRSSDKGYLGTLYGRPLNGTAVIGSNPAFAGDDMNQLLINRTETSGHTVTSTDPDIVE